MSKTTTDNTTDTASETTDEKQLSEQGSQAEPSEPGGAEELGSSSVLPDVVAGELDQCKRALRDLLDFSIEKYVARFGCEPDFGLPTSGILEALLAPAETDGSERAEALAPTGKQDAGEAPSESLTLPAEIWSTILSAVRGVRGGGIAPFVSCEYVEGDDRWYARTNSERTHVVVEHCPGERAIEAARNALQELQARVTSYVPTASMVLPEGQHRAAMERLRERAKAGLREAEKELETVRLVASAPHAPVTYEILLADLVGDITVQWQSTSSNQSPDTE